MPGHEGWATLRRSEARVLDRRASPIPGLFAAGNVMSAVTEMFYSGGGGTLGPGMTFGYLAGRGAAARVR